MFARTRGAPDQEISLHCRDADFLRRAVVNPHATIAIQKIARNIPRTSPTPPDRSDRLHPPHNPSVVGSIPTGPTQPHSSQQQTSQKSLSVVVVSLKHHDVITVDEVYESMLIVNPTRPTTG